jgi:carboxymethylenebutenolidase
MIRPVGLTLCHERTLEVVKNAPRVNFRWMIGGNFVSSETSKESAAMVEDVISVPSPEGDISVITARPDDDGPHPVVVMFHDGPGVRSSTYEVIRRIAGAGYYVVAPDRYHRHGRFVHFEPSEMFAPGADPALRDQFRALLMASTEDKVAADLDAVLAHLATDPTAQQGQMGCIGFCIGARSATVTMNSRPGVFVAGVGLHPSFCVTDQPDSPHLGIAASGGSYYYGFGELDQMQSVAANRPLLEVLDEIGNRGSYDIFAEADHGFAVPGGSYQEEAADAAYSKAFALFDRMLSS